MKILLSNDDGYDSEGIIQLYNVLSSKHEVYIFALALIEVHLVAV